ncbi:MAG: holo-ACP synthase [Acidimicrobiales bacterium]
MKPADLNGSTRITGIGVDAVDVERFRAVLTRRPTLARRLFTEEELAYANQANDPTQRLAARFAAKEAAAKALGTGIWQLHFANVEVKRRRGSPPTIVLHGRAQRIAQICGVAAWHLSMTHTDLVAVAFALALGEPANDPRDTGHPQRIG